MQHAATIRGLKEKPVSRKLGGGVRQTGQVATALRQCVAVPRLDLSSVRPVPEDGQPVPERLPASPRRPLGARPQETENRHSENKSVRRQLSSGSENMVPVMGLTPKLKAQHGGEVTEFQLGRTGYEYRHVEEHQLVKPSASKPAARLGVFELINPESRGGENPGARLRVVEEGDFPYWYYNSETQLAEDTRVRGESGQDADAFSKKALEIAEILVRESEGSSGIGSNDDDFPLPIFDKFYALLLTGHINVNSPLVAKLGQCLLQSELEIFGSNASGEYTLTLDGHGRSVTRSIVYPIEKKNRGLNLSRLWTDIIQRPERILETQHRLCLEENALKILNKYTPDVIRHPEFNADRFPVVEAVYALVLSGRVINTDTNLIHFAMDRFYTQIDPSYNFRPTVPNVWGVKIEYPVGSNGFDSDGFCSSVLRRGLGGLIGDVIDEVDEGIIPRPVDGEWKHALSEVTAMVLDRIITADSRALKLLSSVVTTLWEIGTPGLEHGSELYTNFDSEDVYMEYPRRGVFDSMKIWQDIKNGTFDPILDYESEEDVDGCGGEPDPENVDDSQNDDSENIDLKEPVPQTTDVEQ